MKLVPYTGNLADYTGIMRDASSCSLCSTLNGINGTSLIWSEKVLLLHTFTFILEKLSLFTAYNAMFRYVVTKTCQKSFTVVK